MKCPTCGVSFHHSWSYLTFTYHGHVSGWVSRTAKCPDCGEHTIQIGEGHHVNAPNFDENAVEWRMVQPIGANRGPVPAQVPANIAGDYVEAANVLPLSPKASAALSRRCLQNVLHRQGYKGKDLFKEIEMLLDETDPKKAIPDSLRTTIDGIRHFGNFSAHPITDLTSLQVIDVEPHEAEWSLDILDELFEHFYVKPAQALARKAELDKKLVAAGKLPSR